MHLVIERGLEYKRHNPHKNTQNIHTWSIQKKIRYKFVPLDE